MLKRIAKKSYQYLNWLLNRRDYTLSSTFPPTPIRSNEGSESFFGYYDKCPESPSGAHIIFQEASGESRQRPDPTVAVEVVLMETATKRVAARLPSHAYNWQQGTKLQWLSDVRFIFNDYDPEADRYVAKLYDIESHTVVRRFDTPIYDCFAEEFALTLNYDRLARLAPDYGYFNRMNRAMNVVEIENDGVFYLNLQTGKVRLLVSLAELASVAPRESMRDAAHSVNHLMISPDGTRALAIHRWYRYGQRFDRLIVIASNGRPTPKILADSDMVSHCFWIDTRTVLGYLRGNDDCDAYWFIDVISGAMHRFSSDALAMYGDGHPHVRGDWFVTDTYPDKGRMQHLLYCNWKSGEIRKLGEFFHGFAFDGETRCDLHPRLSADGRRVFFDSVFRGRRRLYSIDMTC